MRTLILALLALLAFVVVSVYSFDVPVTFVGYSLLYLLGGLCCLIFLAACLSGLKVILGKLLRQHKS